MGGADKGLVDWRGQPLVSHVLNRFAPRCAQVLVSANRNLDRYRALTAPWATSAASAQLGLPTVWPDAADLPMASGPLAGILSLARHAHTNWLQVLPCDSPSLPADLIDRLLATALATDADAVVPHTLDAHGESRDHWVCALVHQRSLPALAQQFDAGERKVSRWLCSLRWHRVSFADPLAFANLNALESLHDHR